MIKVGFICEGDTEFHLLRSESFRTLLTGLNLNSVNVINAKGSGNLLPHNISGYLRSLEKDGAKVIIILTDLENDVCITQTKQRISARPEDIVIVAVKQIEAWFLACSKTMSILLDSPNFNFPYPEKENNPFITINNLLIEYIGRGIGRRNNSGKIKLIKRILEKRLDISEASVHDNCPSAKYFIDKLSQISEK